MVAPAGGADKLTEPASGCPGHRCMAPGRAKGSSGYPFPTCALPSWSGALPAAVPYPGRVGCSQPCPMLVAGVMPD